LIIINGLINMVKHLEIWHLKELSNKAYINLCKYIASKNIVAYSNFPAFDDENFRRKVDQGMQGRLLLSLADLLEFVDERVPQESYDIKRNSSHTQWKFDHGKIKINYPDSVELVNILWEIAKIYLEEKDIKNQT